MDWVELEKEFLFRTTLPSGEVIYRLEEDEINAVKSAIKAKKPIPLGWCKRLIPFGEGIFFRDGKVYMNAFGFTGAFTKLKPALKKWDHLERWERYKQECDREREAIDTRFFANVTYDKDGYKIFNNTSSQ